ncbi:MAG TPA: PadR family transcriptional regulator [Solirubrobacteraceae bacterium]|nr:PadR family transcriptional regulator [Solirubrobacteraceae bacterium]
MTGSGFAQEWSGARGARCRPGQGPANWLFSGAGRRGRPPFEDIEDLIALGRMWKGGPFGGGPGWGPHRRGRGRARRGDVRLALLRLLAEEPRNGYQLMQAIEERSEGLWRPSPGSVYPTLAQLEDEGLIRSAEVEGGRRFEITDAGREHLEGRTDEPAPWESPTQGGAENPLAELAPLVIQIGKATFQVASVGDPAQREQAREVLAETRRALYRVLAGDMSDPEAEEEEREV